MKNENITKASQTMAMVVDDIQAAHRQFREIIRPEGRNLADKATTLLLAGLLDAARSLQSQLAELED